MMKRYKEIAFIVLYLIFSYIVNILPFSVEAKLSNYTTILFLDFENLTTLNFESFNVQFMISFLLYLYIICIRMLYVIHENSSFKSLYLLKCSKKWLVKRITADNVSYFSTVYIITFVVILLLSTSTSNILMSNEFFYDIGTLAFYLLRLLGIVCVLSICYEIILISSSNQNLIVFIFCLFVALIFIDMFSNVSFITFTNSMLVEMQYLIIEFFIMFSLYYCTKRFYLNKEDMFND